MKLRNLYLNFWVRNISLYFILVLILLQINFFNGEYSKSREHRAAEIAKDSVELLIIVIQTGIHNYLLSEYWMKRKKLIQYLLRFILLAATYLLINLYTSFSINPNGGASTFMSTVFIYIAGMGGYFIHKNIIERNILAKSELLEKEEEIRYLRAQLNPHFLFNALNNLYGASLSNPKKTPEKILELSDLLRYQIESSQKEMIPLRDEISYLDKYVNYELDRNHKLKINFKKEGGYDDLKIAPLLLMPFIENAIKFSSETDKPMIDMHLVFRNGSLHFKLINNYSLSGKLVGGTNTGILNTKKRLKLIYRNKYELMIKDHEGIYDVQLSLQL